jgi:hypothetical protein
MPHLSVRRLALLVSSLAALLVVVAQADVSTASFAPTTTTARAVTNYNYDRVAPNVRNASGSVPRALVPKGARALANLPRQREHVRPADSLAAEEGTTIYRAVGPNELADLQNLGRYRVPPGGAEGKYFFETPEQASNFARMMGDKPFTTTSVGVSPSELARGDRINRAREGPGYFFRAPDVPSGPVTIFNNSVLP